MKHSCYKAALLTGLLSLFAVTSVSAHDFWLAPEDYAPGAGARTNVNVLVGHAMDRTPWPVTPHRVIALRSVGPDGVMDHQKSVKAYPRLKALPLRLDTSGVHIVTMETTSAVSTLGAEKFANYLAEEGLTPIAIDRGRKNATDTPGREIYSRRGKTIINVGSVADPRPDYLTRPLGLTLEIVPTMNYALETGPIVADIYYRGELTKGVTIGLVSLDTDDGVVDIALSDEKGRVTLARPETGRWMLHAVWSDVLEGDDRAEYDTIFSSLSFEIN